MPRRLSRRAILGAALAGPLLAACDVRTLYGIPAPVPTGRARTRVLLWHADAVNGERVVSRDLLPRLEQIRPGIELAPLGHGDPDDLIRRVGQAAAGGTGPDIFQVPALWLPEVAAQGLLRPLEDSSAALLEGWVPGLSESARGSGAIIGVPSTLWFRQPFYNDALLRDVGLIQNGRTTPPTTWAEMADVSQRIAAPDQRWGSLAPTHRADEELYLHVAQHVHAAGGEPARRDGDRIRLDTTALAVALQHLVDMVQKHGQLPIDRPAFRLAETGKAGLWWAAPPWLRDLEAVGGGPRVGAAPVPRNKRGGALLRARHWSLGAHGQARDESIDLLGWLASDEVSHAYCAGLALPPARLANRERAPYVASTGSSGAVWRAVLDQLGQADNFNPSTFVGYRTVAGRLAGEWMLVLTGKKPISVALAEGEAGANELLRQTAAPAGR